LRIPLDRASPTASRPPGSFSESASGVPGNGDNVSASSGCPTDVAASVGAVGGPRGDAAAPGKGNISPERTDSNVQTAASVTTVAGLAPQQQAQTEVKKATREATVHDHVKSKAFRLEFPFYPGRGHSVDALAHMIKKEFLQKLPKMKEKELPAILMTTAQLLGAYRQDALARRDPFNVDESMKREGGLPLLPYSVRDVVVMPKGLEVSMDNGKWVLEPLLPREQPEGQDWRPTMWRFRVLALDNTVDDTFDLTLRAAGGHDPVAGTVNGLTGFHVGAFRVSLNSAEFEGERFTFDTLVFTFEWKDVAIRSLVFVYLYTLANQHCPGTNVRDCQPLSAGIERVRSWLQAAKELDQKELERTDAGSKEGSGAAPWKAPSMELVKAWLDSLDAAGPDAAGVVG
jgi:hypothetical protein